LSHRDVEAISAFGLLLGIGTLYMALTAAGGEVDVDLPILITVGSAIGFLFSFRRKKAGQS
jgi:hypothetical protein